MGLWANDYELDAGITFDEYQGQAMETAIYPGQGETVGLLYATLGLASEAGEVAGKVKKVLRSRNKAGDDPLSPLTNEELTAIGAELGDVLWYAAAVSEELEAQPNAPFDEDFTLDSLARDNLVKLADRKERGKLQGSGDNR